MVCILLSIAILLINIFIWFDFTTVIRYSVYEEYPISDNHLIILINIYILLNIIELLIQLVSYFFKKIKVVLISIYIFSTLKVSASAMYFIYVFTYIGDFDYVFKTINLYFYFLTSLTSLMYLINLYRTQTKKMAG